MGADLIFCIHNKYKPKCNQVTIINISLIFQLLPPITIPFPFYCKGVSTAGIISIGFYSFIVWFRPESFQAIPCLLSLLVYSR